MPTLTCYSGTNADLFPIILGQYVPKGARIADVTYGKGVFWRNVPEGDYDVLATDLQTGTDFRQLPYDAGSVDALVLDPPYMHGGATAKPSINQCYRNQEQGHAAVLALYLGGLLEARRVLKRGGALLVKCQDEIESGQQRLTHCELLTVLSMIGFTVLDLFVLHSQSVPAMRVAYQRHARKNHSYFIVARFGR